MTLRRTKQKDDDKSRLSKKIYFGQEYREKNKFMWTNLNELFISLIIQV